MYTNTLNPLLQAQNSNNLELSPDRFSGLPHLQLVSDREKYFQNLQKKLQLTPFYTKVLMLMQQYGKKDGRFWRSQQKMAKKLGCDPKTVYRATRYFDEIELVVKFRPKNKWDICTFILSQTALDLIAFFKGCVGNFYDIVAEIWKGEKKPIKIINVPPIQECNSLKSSYSDNQYRKPSQPMKNFTNNTSFKRTSSSGTPQTTVKTVDNRPWRDQAREILWANGLWKDRKNITHNIPLNDLRSYDPQSPWLPENTPVTQPVEEGDPAQQRAENKEFLKKQGLIDAHSSKARLILKLADPSLDERMKSIYQRCIEKCEQDIALMEVS